ncbi:uncharacterized protein LOC111304897 [Durio zibethinus]|uniref:Uncharacterized protein LOC111304897 n=1 Tax=Durio zibethinus TaxID=66656 RepID=A0A6P5ZYS6_DURZI|nr:uncharacterized protein LOC111304897 [Durio zibethinus]
MSGCSCNDIVGYRFHPTDKELIDHYLWNKTLDRDSAVQAIGEVAGDLCDWESGELCRFSDTMMMKLVMKKLQGQEDNQNWQQEDFGFLTGSCSKRKWSLGQKFSDINVDELLTDLRKINGFNKLGNEVASAQKV